MVPSRCSDTDGDGRMDKSIVWADRLPPCYGIIAVRGGVIVTCAPDIVYLADRDNDGKVDVRETLFSGFAVTYLERGINNPRFGLDNWIYVGGPAPLADQVDRYIKHLGQDSFYELY